MLYQDNNAEIRDLFREVEGVSQHGLDELFDQTIAEPGHSFADKIIDAGIISREDLLVLFRNIWDLNCKLEKWARWMPRLCR